MTRAELYAAARAAHPIPRELSTPRHAENPKRQALVVAQTRFVLDRLGYPGVPIPTFGRVQARVRGAIKAAEARGRG